MSLIPLSVSDQHGLNCHWTLLDKFVLVTDSDIGAFAREVCPVDPNQNFRTVDWQQQLTRLSRTIHGLNARHDRLAFGSHSPDQIALLKSEFPDDILTVGINYDQGDHELMLTNLSEFHVYGLTQGLIAANDQDVLALKTLSPESLIDYYVHIFDTQNIIPRSVTCNVDYSVNVQDLFDAAKLSDHFVNLGLDFNDQVREFYHRWLSIQ
jgi:hypothetical protein